MVDDHMPIATPETVAIWIVDQVRWLGALDERLGAAKVRRLFGFGFTRWDQASGRDVFHPAVIAALAMFSGSVSYDATARAFCAEREPSCSSPLADRQEASQAGDARAPPTGTIATIARRRFAAVPA